MSWVSQANIKTIMTAIRNKFTTSDLVIANDAKDTGVELNYASQDGLVTVSPISTSASTEAALHLSNGDDTKKTELTQGTLSYVTGTGSSETYNYMSLLGDGVTFGKNGGGNVQLGGVADPTSAQQVATKNYADNKILFKSLRWKFVDSTTVSANSSKYVGSSPQTFTFNVKKVTDAISAIEKLHIECTAVNTWIYGELSNVRVYAYNPVLTLDAEKSTVSITLQNFIFYNPYSESEEFGGLIAKVWYNND